MKITKPCQFLPWDTDFFGHRIARVTGHRLDPLRVQAIRQWCENREVECLYFLADSNDPETVRLAEDHGFSMVDVRVTLQRDLRNWSFKPKEGRTEAPVHVRPSHSTDVPVLQEIARDAHSNTRFYADPHFLVESCRTLYETWIRCSCQGDADVVLVPEIDDQPVGYVSCHLASEEPHGKIGLVGVKCEARGRGVGQLLVNHALDWFADRGVESVVVVTQGRNIVGQRLYQRVGFLTQSVHLWYHKWMPCCTSEVGE